MAVPDQRILELNPWWREPAAIEQDPKIRTLTERALHWDPPVLGAIEIAPERMHTLRGPRQAGKSTTLKLLIRRLLGEGQRRILYYSFDLSRDNADIVDVVGRARVLHPDPEGPWHLFLDEVTTVGDWQLGVKFIVDNGPADRDFILCTGSSARKVGSEQLPGRKGAGKHYLQLPVSFRDFCRDVFDIAFEDEALSPGQMLSAEGMRAIRRLNIAGADLERVWTVYREVGGFPAAIDGYLRTGVAPESTVDMLWDIVAGDVRDLGRDTVSTLKLLERVTRSLGQPLSWHSLAEEMDVAQATAKDYVRILGESFMLLTVYSWDAGGKGIRPRKQRKIYFIDPLLGRVPRQRLPGGPAPDPGAIRENAVAVALFRSATERLAQAEPAAGSLCCWKSGRGTEIDFLTTGDVDGLRGPRLPVEVKGDSASAIRNARKSIGMVFGRGIIVTASVLDLEHPIPAIPLPVFLAALGERPERHPVTL